MSALSGPVPDTTPRQRWLYALINLGLTIPAQAGSFLLLYYVDVQKLPPSWAATTMSLFAVYNAVNNPIIGFLSDRTRSRWGRRIPYLRFGALPTLVFFALLFFAPVSGAQNPGALLAYFVVVWVLWESFGTAAGTGYLALLPEMFRTYAERTDVAWRMNLVQVLGLLIGLALPPVLAARIGWGPMAAVFAGVAALAIYSGLRGVFERPGSQEVAGLSFGPAVRATFTNPSFLSVVVAQTMRFVTTGTLATGMGFYVKYSLGEPGGTVTTLLLATAFVVAGLSLWPWRHFVARRFGARTTLMLAYALTALSVVPLAFVRDVPGALATTVGFGVALAGLILMGDVIMGDVIDEDEVITGQRREGMYYGMSGFLTTLSAAITALVFGLVTARSGYDPALSVQPDGVAGGFRLFMTVPAIVGALLALAALAFYPLHGERLAAVRRTLAQRRAGGPPLPLS